MSEQFLTDLPPQSVRDAVTDVLSSFGTPLESDEITGHIFEALNINDTLTEENIIFLKNILDDMLLAGRLKFDGEFYSLGSLKKNSDDDVYQVTHIKSPSSNIVTIQGDIKMSTIGSQYYPEAWSRVNTGDILTVELIPEPNNPYDNNAVAVAYKDEILGHLTRSNAAEYFPHILEMNKLGYTLMVGGLVETDPKDINYKYLKLFMPEIAQIDSAL